MNQDLVQFCPQQAEIETADAFVPLSGKGIIFCFLIFSPTTNGEYYARGKISLSESKFGPFSSARSRDRVKRKPKKRTDRQTDGQTDTIANTKSFNQRPLRGQRKLKLERR